MHLLFLDESGTHHGSPNLVVAGISLDESHLAGVVERLDKVIQEALVDLVPDPTEFELHGAEIKSPHSESRKPGKKRKASQWLPIPMDVRMRVLDEAYQVLASLRCGEQFHGCGLFGCVIDARFRSSNTEHERERIAYEHVLRKFDDSLKRDRRDARGLVIHDQRLAAERDIRSWTAEWRESAGHLGGQIERVAMTPVFADSKGSRLLQAADLVAWGINRYYSNRDKRWTKDLWDAFDCLDGHMHGVIHLTPSFAGGQCACPPCKNRTSHGLPPAS